MMDVAAFGVVFGHFQKLVTSYSGHPFVSFSEGMAAVWEDYKPRLRELALEKLGAQDWSLNDIGSGRILEAVISAIEIQDNKRNVTNNLVFWQNRFGHASREHRVLLEAVSNGKARREIETLFWGLYRGDDEEAAVFGELSRITGGKYPLLAYLFFLKDGDRFTPIHPTGFDRAFAAMGVDFVTSRNCSWDNYSEFVGILGSLRPLIAGVAKLKAVRLIDAHSFCWIYTTLLKLESEGKLEAEAKKGGSAHVYGQRDKWIVQLRLTTEATAKNSNGQQVAATVKNKELRMSSSELEAEIRRLFDLQENRCALTGIPMLFDKNAGDPARLASLDRIDSNGHYEKGNLQAVCRFINFWKGAADNDEIIRLLNLVRGIDPEGMMPEQAARA